ncbi:MAG TPA: DUF4394 domain-containing protein [Planctomycetaceae bacterium]|nr:DUF4394 domain-containing protein [Planctomycetaceae bacterium]
MRLPSAILAAAALVGLTLCNSSAFAEELVGFTRIGTQTVLIGIDSERPLLPTRIQRVTGLLGTEQLVGIDLRPANGTLIGVGSTSSNGSTHLYSINVDTGVATAVGPAVNPDLTKASDGSTRFGLDFNPTIDRVRLVSDNDQNIVFHPDTGATTLATPLFYAPADPNFGQNPNVVHIAYDNNIANASTSQQRGIDSVRDVLVTVANNTGTLGTIGSLGVDVGEVGGFDVSASGVAYAALTPAGAATQRLYQINLQTGAATQQGFILLGLVELQGLTALPPTNTRSVAGR